MVRFYNLLFRYPPDFFLYAPCFISFYAIFCFRFHLCVYDLSHYAQSSEEQWLKIYRFQNVIFRSMHEGWNFNSGNYLFTTDTK